MMASGTPCEGRKKLGRLFAWEVLVPATQVVAAQKGLAAVVFDTDDALLDEDVQPGW